MGNISKVVMVLLSIILIVVDIISIELTEIYERLNRGYDKNT